MQVFQHVEGECAALVRLLVEKTEGGNLVLVLLDVIGKGLNHRFGLRFSLLTKTAEGDLIEVDVVDELLTLAAGGF